MTSRRSFLISCSTVPLLSVASSLVLAGPFKKITPPGASPTALDLERSQVDMAIYGWHASHIDEAQTHLICLSASWKADWL